MKPDGPVREKSGHKIICPGTCYHTTGINVTINKHLFVIYNFV